jgi:hypothetical protein
LSSSEGGDFERWLAERFAATGGFTALVLLLEIGERSVRPVSCSFAHVVGIELDWAALARLLDGAGQPWDGVVIFGEAAPGGGPLIESVARARLQARIDEVTIDRMCLNEGGFFDRHGRALRIDPVELH